MLLTLPLIVSHFSSMRPPFAMPCMCWAANITAAHAPLCPTLHPMQAILQRGWHGPSAPPSTVPDWHPAGACTSQAAMQACTCPPLLWGSWVWQ